MTARIAYRPDIDGLRTIAVGSVVLYHAFATLVPGGFVGVDIFFVISGLLITGILVREHERTGRIDLAEFYARRIRRLLPALLAVVATTLALGLWLVTAEGELQSLAYSALATCSSPRTSSSRCNPRAISPKRPRSIPSSTPGR